MSELYSISKYKLALIFFATVCFSFAGKAQIVINEVTADGRVELINVGDAAVDVSGYWLVNFPTYLRLDNADVICDSLLMEAGAIMSIDSFPLDANDGELALFSSQVFSSPLFVSDYLEWGSSGHFTAALAVQADQWTDGDFVFDFFGETGIEYIGTGDASGSWVADGQSSICQANLITADNCDARAAQIFSASDLSHCVDGFADLVTAVSTGGDGDSSLYVLTDANNRVLDADVAWPVDFEQYPAGIYYIRQLNYSGPLSGLAVNLPLYNASGCIASSNIIAVTRQEADGGLVINASGNASVQGCGGGISFTVDHINNSPGLPYLYVVVNDDTNIVISSQNASTDSVITIKETAAANYRVYGVSGEVSSIPAGANFSIIDGQPCIEVSNNSIRIFVLPNTTMAGEVTPSEPLVYCPSDSKPPVSLDVDGVESGDAQRWILARADGEIINVSTSATIDIDTLSEGTYGIHRISYDFGIDGLMAGGNLSTLLGCFDLSSPRHIFIEAPAAGLVTLDDGGDRLTSCTGSARFDIVADSIAPNVPYYYLVADVGSDSIVAVIPRTDSLQSIDLSSLAQGESRLYGYSQTGPLQAQPGMLLSDLTLGDCAALSMESILVVKTPNPYEGGLIASPDVLSFCIDSVPDLVEVILSFAVSDSSQYIVTDENDRILRTGLNSPVQFTDSIPGLSRIYHLAYGADLEGLEIGNRLDQLDGCVSISNAIEVRRDFVDGGTISNPDSIALISACEGGLVVDVQHVTSSTLLPYHYLVVEAPSTIVAVLDPADGPIYDLSYLPVDSYQIYGWSHVSRTLLPVGSNLAQATDDDCEALSSNSLVISVLPNVSSGGVISTNGPATICVDSIPDLIDLTLDGASGIVRINYVLTDEDYTIVDVPDSNPPYNLDNGVPGITRIYNLAHNGAIGGLVVGNSLAQVRGCYSLSNELVIDKVLPDAGTVQTTLGETRVEFCAGDIVVDMQHIDVTTGLAYSYVVTDDDGLITAVFDEDQTNSVSISGADASTCRIYGWSYDGGRPSVVGMTIDDLELLSCSAVSANFVTVLKVGGLMNGGILTAANLEILCADGIPDPIEVTLSGAFGSNSSWVVVADDGTILSLPFASPFNLDPAGGGDFTIYNVSYEDGLEGLNIFASINDLRGCFDLSNPLFVTNVEAEPSEITTSEPTEICLGAGGEMITFIETSQGSGLSVWLVTDGNGRVESFSNTGVVDFSGSGPGVSFVSKLSYVGSLEGLEVGATIDDLEGCFAESNRVTVTRTVAQAGVIRLVDGTMAAARCVGAAQLQFSHSTPNPGQQYSIVLTDSNDDILRVEPSAGIINFSDLSAGVYKIYGWSSDGGTTPALGQNVGTLEQGCGDVTSMAVDLQIVDVDGSTVVSTSGPAIIACLDGVPDPIQLFTTTTATALPYSYLVADLNGSVLEVYSDGTIDLEASSLPVTRIYGFSHDAISTPAPGDNINIIATEACGDLSENFITVTRQSADGGSLISELGSEFTVCIDEVADPVLFTPNTASTSLQYSVIVTDDNNIIVSVFVTPLIDFNALGVGEFRVFGWSHSAATIAQVGQDVGSLDQDCGSLSRNFVIVHNVDMGSPCTTSTLEESIADFDIYPNPAQDEIFIKGYDQPIRQVIVVTPSGRRLQVAYDQGRVDLSTMPVGYYVLEIYGEDTVQRRSFIVAGK
jgi:hypothetical protein